MGYFDKPIPPTGRPIPPATFTREFSLVFRLDAFPSKIHLFGTSPNPPPRPNARTRPSQITRSRHLAFPRLPGPTQPTSPRRVIMAKYIYRLPPLPPTSPRTDAPIPQILEPWSLGIWSAAVLADQKARMLNRAKAPAAGPTRKFAITRSQQALESWQARRPEC